MLLIPGDRIGRLTILPPDDWDTKYSIFCQCDCGNTIYVPYKNLVRLDRPTKSCGCLRNKKQIDLKWVRIKNIFSVDIYQGRKETIYPVSTWKRNEQYFYIVLEPSRDIYGYYGNNYRFYIQSEKYRLGKWCESIPQQIMEEFFEGEK